MNVAFDQWIPVVDTTGTRTLASLHDVLVQGEKFVDLAVRPHERVSLMRFFLCVAHAALNGPKNYDEWRVVPKRLPEAVKKYLTDWKDSFELFHKEKPWLQVASLKGIEKEGEDSGKTSSVALLDFELATGNTSTLHDHGGQKVSRQIEPERIALSKNKDKVKELSTKGHVIQKPDDIIKDPYVLEFLNLRESKDFMESDLEQGLIEKLQEFLLELGKGFAFVVRQKRITIDGDHFYIDLVFYNYLLRCFLLIDLKIGKLTHKDIGQMDFYVRYFEHEVKQESDSPTIGLILCSDKNEAMVKYTLLENSQRIFASKYKLYLPSEEELKEELEREKQFLELELKEKRSAKLLGGLE